MITMIEFILTHSFQLRPDGTVGVCLRPSDATISDYISTWRNYDDITQANAELGDFILEMTPLLYADFQAMENIPASIKSIYLLED
jgi:hypothetical protein